MGYPTPAVDVQTEEFTGNKNLKSQIPHLSNLTTSTSPSQRRAYFDELLSIDFTKPFSSEEKYLEYCRAFQILGLELKQEVDRLQAKLDATSAPVNTSSSRRTTDDSDFSKEKAPVVPEGKVTVVYSSTSNDLCKVKGRDMHSTYIPVNLPSYHWMQDSLHMYFSIPRGRVEQPKIVASSKKLQSTLDTDFKWIRTINLGKLGFRIWVRRVFGQLKTIYVLAPETRAVSASNSTAGI